jgi:hypothetical protein
MAGITNALQQLRAERSRAQCLSRVVRRNRRPLLGRRGNSFVHLNLALCESFFEHVFALELASLGVSHPASGSRSDVLLLQ